MFFFDFAKVNYTGLQNKLRDWLEKAIIRELGL